jgi:hypothetical protein
MPVRRILWVVFVDISLEKLKKIVSFSEKTFVNIIGSLFKSSKWCDPSLYLPRSVSVQVSLGASGCSEMVPFKAIVKGCLVGIIVCIIYVIIFATSSIDVCSRNTDCNCKNNENKNKYSDLNGNSHSLCILVPYR